MPSGQAGDKPNLIHPTLPKRPENPARSQQLEKEEDTQGSRKPQISWKNLKQTINRPKLLVPRHQNKTTQTTLNTLWLQIALSAHLSNSWLRSSCPCQQSMGGSWKRDGRRAPTQPKAYLDWSSQGFFCWGTLGPTLYRNNMKQRHPGCNL